MRLIDADMLKPDIKTFTSAYSEELTEFYSQKAIANAPTIEAEPVRHGHWVCHHDIHGISYFCSNCTCGVSDTDTENYCHYCGAKMDGKDGNCEDNSDNL